MLPTFSDPDGTVAQLQVYANGVLNSNVGNPQQNQLLTFNGTTAVPGTILPATMGTIDASGLSAPHGYAVR